MTLLILGLERPFIVTQTALYSWAILYRILSVSMFLYYCFDAYRAKAQAGQTVLIHGASGGVGLHFLAIILFSLFCKFSNLQSSKLQYSINQLPLNVFPLWF